MPVEITGDGSKTIYSERFGEHYHSTFGAANESNHVFIEAGYQAVNANPVSILEIGFGTGLNTFLTLQQTGIKQRSVFYEAIDLYPVDQQTVQSLSDDEFFRSLHTVAWEEPANISPCFVLKKRKIDLRETVFSTKFDVVYFDAFSPSAQPEMWTREIFSGLFAVMNTPSVLVTYCAKGEVRRTMQSVGFSVERLPGPVGKREMLRARKF